MMNSDGLSLVKSRRMETQNQETYQGEVIESTSSASVSTEKLIGAVADHFGEILQIAHSMVEIRRMQVETNNAISLMKSEQERLIAETQCYVTRKREETDGVIKRLDAIRMLMRDFYLYNNTTLSGQEFSDIMVAILDKIGGIE